MRDHIDKRIAAVVAGLALIAPAAASADTYANTETVSVINNAGVPAALVAQMEMAAQAEINGPVKLAWGTPTISFAPGSAITMTLVPESQWVCPFKSADYDCGGYHFFTDPPAAESEWLTNDLNWDEYAFSHELVEMTVDPAGLEPEVCDNAINQNTGLTVGTLDGVTIADFQRPDGSVWSAPYTPPTTAADVVHKHRRHRRHHHRRVRAAVGVRD